MRGYQWFKYLLKSCYPLCVQISELCVRVSQLEECTPDKLYSVSVINCFEIELDPFLDLLSVSTLQGTVEDFQAWPMGIFPIKIHHGPYIKQWLLHPAPQASSIPRVVLRVSLVFLMAVGHPLPDLVSPVSVCLLPLFNPIILLIQNITVPFSKSP